MKLDGLASQSLDGDSKRSLVVGSLAFVGVGSDGGGSSGRNWSAAT